MPQHRSKSCSSPLLPLLLFIILVFLRETYSVTFPPRSFTIGVLSPSLNDSTTFVTGARIAIQELSAPTSFLSQLNVSLVLKHYATNGNPQLSYQNAFRYFLNDKNPIGIVGPLYSSESEQVSKVSNIFKKPLISFASSSVTLSSELLHPFFLRTCPSNAFQAEAIIDFCYTMNWNQIGVIVTNDAYGTDGSNELKRLGFQKHIKIIASASFNADLRESTDDVETIKNVDQALLNLKKSGAKVVVTFITTLTPLVLQRALELQMLTSEYIWIMSETAASDFSVSAENIVRFEGTKYNSTELLSGLIFSKTSTGFWTRKTFLLDEWSKYQNNMIDQWGLSIYDAVLSYARAIESILKKELIHNGLSDSSSVAQFVARTDSLILNGTHLLQELLSVDFVGAGGRVKFSKQGDLIGSVFDLFNVDRNQTQRHIGAWEIDRGLILSNYMDSNPIYLYGDRFVYADSQSNSRAGKETIGSAGKFMSVPHHGFPPSARISFSLELYEQNDQIILFGGGLHTIERFNDIWAYSIRDSSWSILFPGTQKPSARRSHVGFVIEDKFIVFAGFDGRSLLNDMWEFDLNLQVWREIEFFLTDGNHDQTVSLASIVPEPRMDARAVTSGRTAYVFGGEGNTGDLQDLWEFTYDTVMWRKLVPVAGELPPPRHDHCTHYHDDHIIVFGGRSPYEPNGMNDLWVFSLSNLTWTQIEQTNAPDDRFSFVCEVYGGKLFVGLGYTYRPGHTVAFKDFYSVLLDYSTSKWTWTKVFETNDEAFQERDNLDSVLYQDSFIFFGGWGPKNILNDYWRFDCRTMKLELIHHESETPQGAYGHTGSIIGDSIYYFGGYTARSLTSNLIQKFSISSTDWSVIDAGGTLPAARMFHSTSAVGDLIYVFGGQTDETNAVFLDDLWEYSVSLNTWRKVNPTGTDKPTPRAGHTAIIIDYIGDEPRMYIYGGRNKNELLNELYVLLIESEVWMKVEIPPELTPKTAYPFLLHIQSTLFWENDEVPVIVFYGGEDFATKGAAAFICYDPISNVWRDFPLARVPFGSELSQTQLTLISDDEIIVHGGMYYDEVKDTTARVTAFGTFSVIETSSSVLKPRRRAGHTASLFGDQIYYFGGFGSLPNKNRRSASTIYGDVVSYTIGPICFDEDENSLRNQTAKLDDEDIFVKNTTNCIKCGMGTFHQRGRCVACPRGYFNDYEGVKKCIPCGPGFYSDILGSNSARLCFPCPFGTYSPAVAASTCVPCDPDKFCPIGSSTQFDRNYRDEFNKQILVDNSQPSPAKENSETVFRFNSITITICIGLALLVYMVFALAYFKYGRYYQYLDIMFTDKHNVRMGVMMKRRTKVGGMWTVFTCIMMLGLVCFSLFPFIINNTNEIRTLIPNLALSKGTKIQSTITAQVRFIGYTGKCTVSDFDSTAKKSERCADRIQVKSDQINGAVTYRCSNQAPQNSTQMPVFENNLIGMQNSSCVVTIECINCSLESVLGKLTVGVEEKSAFSAGFEWAIQSSAGYPGQVSKLAGFVRNDEYHFFRGKQTSIIHLQYVNTIFTNLQTNPKTVATGAHLDYQNFEFGSVVSYKSFNHKNGVYFQFQFHQSPSSLEVTRSAKKETITIIADILGSLSGLYGGMAFLLTRLDSGYYWLFKAKKGITFVKAEYKRRKTMRLKQSQKLSEMQVKLLDTTEGITNTGDIPASSRSRSSSKRNRLLAPSRDASQEMP